MILKHKKFGVFNSVRVLYQGEPLIFGKNDYVTVVSYEPLPLAKEGFGLKEKNLANIYLDGSDEEILARFSRNTRNEILRTEKILDLEFRVDDDYQKEIYSMYRAFEKWQGRKPWREQTLVEGIIQFNAYYKGELISSLPCYDLKPALQVRAMFSRRHADPKIASLATRRLIYEACKWGRANGYAFLGLGAVNTSTEQKAGVAQFKMFFNPRIEKEYTYIRKPAFFKLLGK